jgi:hypothetical protein
MEACLEGLVSCGKGTITCQVPSVACPENSNDGPEEMEADVNRFGGCLDKMKATDVEVILGGNCGRSGAARTL